MGCDETGRSGFRLCAVSRSAAIIGKKRTFTCACAILSGIVSSIAKVESCPYLKFWPLWTDTSLGKALALPGKVNEKRLFQIVRADYPSDVKQLRRLLKQIEPSVDWYKMAKQLWHWDKYRKRNLMEDFVLNQRD